MAAYVKEKFENGFLLDEERLRKICDILNTRLKTVETDVLPVIKIYRSDSLVYTTLNLDDVIREKNHEGEKIVRLSITVRLGNTLNFYLDFSGEGISLNIEGENRDFVFLLTSELRTYISSEVAILMGKNITAKSIVLFILMPLMVLSTVHMMISSSGQLLAPPFESQDIHEKLNYLINKQVKHDITPYLAYLMGGAMLALVIAIAAEAKINNAIRYFYPINVFLFGKGSTRFQRAKDIRNKIYWGITIASLVGVVSGIIVWWFTK